MQKSCFLDKKERMEVLCGLSLTPSHPPAVGRLIFGGRKEMPSMRGACISVVTSEEDKVIGEADVEGIVVVGSSSFGRGAVKQSTRPILALPVLAERCMGKIAVLDPALGKLFVSPDLETVSYYSARLGKTIGEISKPTFACADAKIVSVCRDAKNTLNFCESGWVLDLRCRRPYSEESVCEQCMDFAELAVGQTVTVVLDFSERTFAAEELSAAVRGIFRAAVYGNFSILIGGCLCEEDVQRCRGTMNRSFCELAGEGREFNGYIPKGLLVENLLYPLSGGSFDGMDFCCIDITALSKSLTGLTWEELTGCEQVWGAIGESLCAVIRTRGDLPLWGWFCEKFPPRELCRALGRAGMVGWIFGKDCDVETNRYLREIWENTQ